MEGKQEQKKGRTVVIFTGCHLRNRHVIHDCNTYEVDTYMRMAAAMHYPMTIRKETEG